MVILELDGIPQLQQAFARFAQQAHQALVQALRQEAEDILDASLPLVPVDTTLLILTGMVEEQPAGADIRYGGHGLAPYAILQHEETSFNHPNGGQDHYLSQPFLTATGDMPARLGASMASQIRP